MSQLLVAKADGTLLARVDLAHRRVLSIGRSPRCDLVLHGPSISRRHALLFRHPGGWRIVDTGSRNGIATEAGRTAVIDLDERTWCRLGSAHLWLDPAGIAPPAPHPVPEDDALLVDPERASGPVATLLDPHDRPLRRVALDRHECVLIGSAPGCDIQVDDEGVGPLQAILYREQTRWAVADAGAGPALLVDGLRTRRHRLHGGLVATLGRHRLVVSGPLPRPAAGHPDESAEASDHTDTPDDGRVSAFLPEAGERA